MRAVVVAVGEFPQMNARFKDDDGIVERHRAVHVGVATQTSKGLMSASSAPPRDGEVVVAGSRGRPPVGRRSVTRR